MSLQSVGLLVVLFGAINLVRMALFLIGSDLYGLRAHLRQRRGRPLRRLPSFTVVIPAYNEQRTIRRCLRSVVASDYPLARLQIIVVDDGSTDGTVAVARAYQRRHHLQRLTVLRRPHGGKARALNAALRRARGTLVMCLDADSTIAPDALRSAAAHFADQRVVALAANVKIRDDGSLLSLIQQFEYLICYQMKRAHTVFNIEYIIGGIGSTFRRSVLAEVGYYDTDTVTEDIDLTMKFLRRGNKAARVAYGADVIATTEPVGSLLALIRQRDRWKFGRCQTFWKNRGMFFATDRKHGKLLTWGYLPFAIFSDLAFFFEPLLVGFLIYVTLRYHDPWTLGSALVVITAYIALNILAEETVPLRRKLPLLLMAPAMYVLFYALSFVEYVALLRSLLRLHRVPASISKDVCAWTPVERAARG